MACEVSVAGHPDRIEAIARAMCEGAGNDPDQLVFSAVLPLQRLSGRADYQVVPTGHAVIPAWMVYAKDAEAALSYLSGAVTAIMDSKMFESFPGFSYKAQAVSSTNGQS